MESKLNFLIQIEVILIFYFLKIINSHNKRNNIFILFYTLAEINNALHCS